MFSALSDPNYLWIVVTGFVISFVLAFGIGANDVANSFGTSVGAKVLTLQQACILATIFELAGSLLLGAKVSETIRKGIIDGSMYVNDTELLLLGLVAALGGSCIWLLVATFARVPVSGTHSIVGATVGFSLVAKGFSGVSWYQLGLIVVSWFVSPVLSAMVSVLLFFLVQHFILNKNNSLEYGLRALPFIYGITLVTNLFSVFFDGPPLLRFDLIPTWGAFVASFGIGLLCSVIIKFIVVPALRVHIRWHCERRRIEQQQQLLEAEERARALTEESELQNGTLVSDDAGSEQAVLLANSKANKSGKRKSPLSKLKHLARKHKTAKCADDKTALNQGNHTERNSQSNSCHSQVHPIETAEHSTYVHDPLISSCSKLPLDVSTDLANPDVRSTSVSKLEVQSIKSDGEKTPVTSKSSKFVVQRIQTQNEDNGMPKVMRSEYTSTTSIFRESNAKDGSDVNPKGESLDAVLNPKVDADLEAGTDLPVKTDKEDVDEATCCGRKCKAIAGVNSSGEVVDSPECARLFSFLQILTAVFGAFAHGGNDVSNAIGPLIGIWLLATEKPGVSTDRMTPWWILLYGGAGISVGLWVWGRRVIETLGEDLTKVTPSSGFCIELGAALTVLVASNAKMPVSTTHCKVGSVVGVGRYRSRDNVDWRVFRNIILAWFVTVPASAALGAGIMWVLMEISKLISAGNVNYNMNNGTMFNGTYNYTSPLLQTLPQ